MNLGWLQRLVHQRSPANRLNIAVNSHLVRGSWGGGNQWLEQFRVGCATAGIRLSSNITSDSNCAVIMHSKPDAPATFTISDIERHRSQLFVVHRVNEADAHRGSNEVDESIKRLNVFADLTIFISSWVRDYHATRWFDITRPHAVILNAASERYFHPFGTAQWSRGKEPLRIATHHWSTNRSKGFDIYQNLDTYLAEGRINDVEFHLIGRYPAEYRWKKAILCRPCSGSRLGDSLRNCHAYITASRFEAGGMHFIEGIQCGLPLLYHRDGGGVIEIGRAVHGIEYDASTLVEAVEQLKGEYHQMRAATLDRWRPGQQMVAEYLAEMIRHYTLRGR